MAEWMQKWGWVALLVAAGAVLRVGFVWRHPGVAGDSLVYGDLAQNMLRHHVFGLSEMGKVRPTLIRLPGYPLFLAACFAVFGMGNFLAVMGVQVVVGVADFCLIGALAWRLMGRRAGLGALGLGALCPFTANYCAVPLTETCTVFCVSLVLFSLERWRAGVRVGRAWNGWMVGIGVGLGYGVLLRPDEVLLAVVVLPAMGWIGWREGGRKMGPVIVVTVAMAMPFLLWGVRNWRVFHVVQPLAPRFANDPGEENPDGFQRWYRTWAIDFEATVDVYWNYDGSPVRFEDLPGRAYDGPGERAETQRLYAAYNDAGASTAAIDAGFARLAETRVRERPVRFYLGIPAAKVADMWLRPRTEFMNFPLDWWRFRAHERASWESLGYAVWDWVYLGMAVVGLWRWRKSRDLLMVVMVGFVGLRCALLWTIDNAEPRYTLECFPVVVLLAGMAVWGAGERSRSRAIPHPFEKPKG